MRLNYTEKIILFPKFMINYIIIEKKRKEFYYFLLNFITLFYDLRTM